MRKKTITRSLRSRLTALFMAGAMLTVLPTGILPGSPAAAEAASSYWAQPYLQEMVDSGIMTGNSRGNLNPSDRITRAEFAAMINRALGFTDTGSTMPFNDVNVYDWYYDDLSIGYNEEYFQGVGGGKAAPKNPITREAAVTMLGRALKLQTDPLAGNSFTDNSQISNWARPYVNLASSKGFVSGYLNGAFGPGNSITRAEVAKIIGELTGQIISSPQLVRLDYVEGNVTLTASGGGLKNTTIAGDLYITDGVDTGSILLDNVTVLGQVIISGAGEAQSGECSVVFRDCEISQLITDVPKGKKLSVTTQGNTIINNSTIKSTAFIQSANDSGNPFLNLVVDVPEGQSADLAGSFSNVILKSPASALNLQKGFISRLTVDEDALGSTVFLAEGTDTGTLFCDTASSVTGKGTIGESVISTNGTVIEQLPDNITIRPGISAIINGVEMNQSQGDKINIIPEILANFPKVSEEDTTSVKGTFRVNKAGKLYWMVVPQGYAAPTEAQMINPKLIGSAVSSGNLNVSEASEATISITGLKAGTDYVLYGMLVDVKEQNSAIKKKEFSTVDNSSPKFTYTKVDAQTSLLEDGSYSYSIDTVATVSKNATVYYMVLESGKTAPSATDLIAQRMTAAAKGYRSFSKNVSTSILMSGLEESVKYDLYMIAVDDNGRQSAVFKTTVTMADTTAPSLLNLKSTPGTDNIKVTYTPDENCAKVYWALYYTNSPTVETLEKDTLMSSDGLMWYETDSARSIVTRGTGALQSSSSLTAKARTASNFTISGLQKTRYYKLYMVLEDASGNQSVVYTLSTATVDKVDPAVEISLGSSTDGKNLIVGTAEAPTTLSLSFSEVVLGQSGEILKDLTQYGRTDQELGSFIRLYRGDESQINDPSRQVKIRWSDVTASVTAATEEYPEHTILTFSVSNSDNTALNLNTGEVYTFVFTYNPAINVYITDKSGNTMKKIPTGSASGGNYTAVTASFNCVSPSVLVQAPSGEDTIIRYGDPGEPEADYNLDFSFRIDPTQANKAASDELCYDFIIAADTALETDIFRKTGNGSWERIASGVNLRPDSSYRDTVSVKYGEVKTHGSASGGTSVTSSDFTSQRFNTMGNDGSIVIALHITNYDSDPNRDIWNGSASVQLTCITGKAAALAQNANGSNTENVTGVGSAIDSVTFTDNTPPIISYSYNRSSDSTIDVNVDTNKDVRLYWVAIPNGNLNTEMLKSSELVFNYIKKAGDVKNGYVYNTSGEQVLQIHGSTYTVTIDGLAPDTEYTIYFIGENINGRQIVQYADSISCTNINGDNQFLVARTEKVQAPEFLTLVNGSTNYVTYLSNQSSGNTMVFQVLTDRPANVYWKVVTAEDDQKTGGAAAIINTETDTFKGYTEIKNSSLLASSGYLVAGNTGGTPVASTSTPNTNGMYETNISIDFAKENMKSNTSYTMYVIAESPTQENVFSTKPRYVKYTFAKPDTEVPKIDALDLNFRAARSGIPGHVQMSVYFDKELYYLKNGRPAGMTVADVRTEAVGTDTSGMWSFTPTRDQVQNMVDGSFSYINRTYNVSGAQNGTGYVNRIDLEFDYNTLSATETTSFATVNLSQTLCNSSGASAGNLYLRFSMDGDKCIVTASLGQSVSNPDSSLSKTAVSSAG
ncbi:MAG: S-layer homology domain-containing protein [Anaerovoracaceae bacterium]